MLQGIEPFFSGRSQLVVSFCSPCSGIAKEVLLGVIASQGASIHNMATWQDAMIGLQHIFQRKLTCKAKWLVRESNFEM